MPLKILDGLDEVEVKVEMDDSFELQVGQSFEFVVAEVEHLEEGEEQRVGQEAAIGDVVAAEVQMRGED
jgi:hypothetical protein